MKTKIIISSKGIKDFEDKLNEFISSPEIHVIDIKYSIAEIDGHHNPVTTFSALVIYKD